MKKILAILLISLSQVAQAGWTNFYVQTTGSNLNSGEQADDDTGAIDDVATYTYASGNWDADATGSTHVFTVASGNPSSDGVDVGDWASVYADGSTVTGFVGLITARDTTTITISTTLKSGTAPTDGTGNRTLKIGGAWQGPNGASGFPFGFVQNTMGATTSDYPQVNIKGGTNYSITATISNTLAGPIAWVGYTTNINDGGIATFDGGNPNPGFTMFSFGTNGGHIISGIKVQNNGTASSVDGLDINSPGNIVFRCSATGIRRYGIVGTSRIAFVECETYNCNTSNASAIGGFRMNASMSTWIRCISHGHSTGSNCHGAALTSGSPVIIDSIFSDNAGSGMHSAQTFHTYIINSDFYSNTGQGINLAGTVNNLTYVENTNFIGNGSGGTGYGITNGGTQGRLVFLQTCAFGSGTAANSQGTYPALTGDTNGEVTYATDAVPWNDPVDGDFSITLSAAKNTGRGTYTQSESGQAGSVSYPDIGAAQHAETAGGGTPSSHAEVN